MSKVSTVGIVVPTKNSEDFLQAALLSVLSQEIGEKESIHLHIQDGLSTDRTAEIVKSLDSYPFPENVTFTYSAEEDKNMYHALNLGFSKIHCEFMTWLGSDDILVPKSISTVISYFRSNPEFQWVTGVTCLITEKTDLTHHFEHGAEEFLAKGFPNSLLQTGSFDGRRLPFVMQEGTYWTKDLWDHSGKSLDDSLRYAGDFELWSRFAQKTELVQLDYVLAAHRKRPGQLSENLEQYYLEINRINRRLKNASAGDFSTYGYTAVRLGEDAEWVTSDEKSKKFWGGRLDFFPITEGSYFEGPYPETGILEMFIWIGKKVKFQAVRKSPVSRAKRIYRVRLINEIQDNQLIIKSMFMRSCFELQASELIQEFEFGLRARTSVIQISSKRFLSQIHDKRLLGFKLVSIEIKTDKDKHSSRNFGRPWKSKKKKESSWSD